MGSDCLIVGSGMSGLAAANVLKDKGFKVTVLDKGRGTGGRIATRRFSGEAHGEGVFDYGAQYFTARDPRFKNQVQKWIDAGVARKWTDGFCDSSGNFVADGTKRFTGSDNMRSITKYMAGNIEVHQSAKVISFRRVQKKWETETEDGRKYVSNAILLTPPVPQSLSLLDNSGIELDRKLKSGLSAVKYDPCIALMIICDGTTKLNRPGGMRGDGKNIIWICDNSIKGVKADAVSVTVHASADFSKNFWNFETDEIYEKLKGEIEELTGTGVYEYQVHKWLYSLPVKFYNSNFAFTEFPGPLFFAGDGFCEGRIEGAFISGLEAGNEISKYFQR